MEASPSILLHGRRQTLTTFLFFLLLIQLQYYTSIATSHPTPTSTTSIDFIKSRCKTTTYPRLCYATLHTYANQIHSDPKLLAGKSISVALTTARSSSSEMIRLARLQGLSPKVKGAMDDCVRLVGDSVIQLQRSVNELGDGGASTNIGTNFQFKVNSVQTWVSTAVTDAYTCMNAFDGEDMFGNVKIIVSRDMSKLAQLTSNALSLINGYYASTTRNNNAAHHHHRAHHHHHQIHHP